MASQLQINDFAQAYGKMAVHKRKRKKKRNKWRFRGNIFTFFLMVSTLLSLSIYIKLYGLPGFNVDYNDLLTAAKHYIVKPKVSVILIFLQK